MFQFSQPTTTRNHRSSDRRSRSGEDLHAPGRCDTKGRLDLPAEPQLIKFTPPNRSWISSAHAALEQRIAGRGEAVKMEAVHSVDVEGRRVRIDCIAASYIDFGTGVLRGVLSRPELAHLDKQKIEDAIDHIRAAARFVERYQHEVAKRAARPRRKRRS